MAKAWEGERNIGNKGTPSTIIFITKVAKLHFIFFANFRCLVLCTIVPQESIQ